MKVAFVLAVVGAAAATCPSLECTEYLDPGVCGFRASGSDSFLVRPCGAGKSCPAPSTLGDSTLLTCRADDDTSVRYLRDLQSGGNYVLRHEGETCHQESDYCMAEEGLVCHCGADCVCVQGGNPDDSCATVGCAWGSSCLNDVCTTWFTQEEGVQVSNPWLCAAMSVDENGACLRADTNDHDIFEPCEEDMDCTGVNQTRGRCRCGGLGVAYCDLKSNDPPSERLKQAYLDRSVPEILYWQLIVENWAFLQRNDGDFEEFLEFPACTDQVWPQLDFQLRALPAIVDFEAAHVLAFAAGLCLFI